MSDITIEMPETFATISPVEIAGKLYRVEWGMMPRAVAYKAPTKSALGDGWAAPSMATYEGTCVALKEIQDAPEARAVLGMLKDDFRTRCMRLGTRLVEKSGGLSILHEDCKARSGVHEITFEERFSENPPWLGDTWHADMFGRARHTTILVSELEHLLSFKLRFDRGGPDGTLYTSAGAVSESGIMRMDLYHGARAGYVRPVRLEEMR